MGTIWVTKLPGSPQLLSVCCANSQNRNSPAKGPCTHRTQTYIYIFIYIYIYIYVCIHTHVYKDLRIRHWQTCIHVCIYACMYVCMYVIMYIFLGHEEPVYKALERLVCVCVCVRACAGDCVGLRPAFATRIASCLKGPNP